MKICTIGECAKYKHKRCCLFCEERETCKSSCQHSELAECEHLEEQNEVAELSQKEITLINAISELEKQKVLITKQSDEMRTALLQAMEQYGVKAFENDTVKVTYVAPTERVSVDTVKLKKDMPHIIEKYQKTSKVKSSVKITLKLC